MDRATKVDAYNPHIRKEPTEIDYLKALLKLELLKMCDSKKTLNTSERKIIREIEDLIE